jgi:hypothetical protein
MNASSSIARCASKGVGLGLTGASVSLLLLFCSRSANAEVVLKEERGGVVAQVEIDRKAVALSGEVLLTLTVEGPARVEVVQPRPLLTKASNQLWRVRETELPLVENLEKDRQRWRQVFRLSPFVTGPAIEIAPAPLHVKTGNALEMEITWSGLAAVEVTTSIKDADPTLLRSITGIEPAPAAKPGPQRHWLIVLAVLIGAVATLAIVGVLARRGGRPVPGPVHDSEWALRELEELSRSSNESPAAFARLAEILRSYLHHRYDVPASRLTTSELIAFLDQGDRLASKLIANVRTILERCDIAKFAEGIGSAAHRNDCSDCIDLAVSFISQSATSESNHSSDSAPA